MASRQWTMSVSSSFASLVSAIETMTERGITHRVYCEQCRAERARDDPGATEKFRSFFETYAPGAALRKRRTQMYELRSGILHGSDLMLFDQDLAFGWDPPGLNEMELHSELRSITRIALRNCLKNPPTIDERRDADRKSKGFCSIGHNIREAIAHLAATARGCDAKSFKEDSQTRS